MSLETKVDLLSERARPIAPLPNVARKMPSLIPTRSIDRRRYAEAVMCLYTSPVRHLMAATVTDVLLLERFVPDRGVAVERAAEGDVERAPSVCE